MEDIELILRFFALRHAREFKNGKIDFLDSYMRKTTTFKQEDIDFLDNIFSKTIRLADSIYGEKLFKPFDINKQEWSNRSYKEYYDAVMVGCSYNLENEGKLIQRKEQVIDATRLLLSNKTNYKLFTGEGSTKAGIQKRIELFSQMLDRVAKN